MGNIRIIDGEMTTNCLKRHVKSSVIGPSQCYKEVFDMGCGSNSSTLPLLLLLTQGGLGGASGGTDSSLLLLILLLSSGGLGSSSNGDNSFTTILLLLLLTGGFGSYDSK
jgi:hypothetical protein